MADKSDMNAAYPPPMAGNAMATNAMQIPPQGASTSNVPTQHAQVIYQPPQYYQEGFSNGPPTAAATSATRPFGDDMQDDSAKPKPAFMDEEIYKLTPHVKMSFAETFVESETSQGFPFMPKVNELIYTWTHFAVYGSLSMIISPIMSAVWAIMFAFYHLAIVWMVQPMLKSLFLSMRISEMIIRATVRTCLDPVFRSMALMLSSIRGLFKLSDSNINLNMKTTPQSQV